MRFFTKVSTTCLIALCLSSSAIAQTVKRGVLAGGSVKWTTGSVEIIKTNNGHEVQLGANFKTKKGPSLWVYLGNEKPEKRVARLRSVTGAQSYMLRPSIDVQRYKKIFIYCVPFNAVFGSAALR